MVKERVQRLPELVNANEGLVRRGQYLDVTFLLEVGDAPFLVQVRRGRVEAVVSGPFVMPRWAFALRAPADEWARFWEDVPPPGHHDLMAMIKRRALRLEGDVYPFMSNLFYFKAVLASLRPGGATASVAPLLAAAATEAAGRVSATFDPIVGRYLRVDIDARAHRVYVEEAGQGVPLVCLHTAGSDTRQYRGLMNDPRILEHFRVIAFDMPWHGKSSPPAGWHLEEYRLTSRGYASLILSVCDALELDRPVVIGCSIGGRAVLKLALEHPRRFRALIGLQAGAHVDPYYDLAWLNRPDVHGGEVCAAVVSGLVAPTSPDEHRWETLWHYMQGGPGVFKGDLHFYKIDGDIRSEIERIDTSGCSLYLLSGEYDYSCTPQETLDVARRVKGAEAQIMPGLGHFPMSEDPERFNAHLIPVLRKILSREAGDRAVGRDA